MSAPAVNLGPRFREDERGEGGRHALAMEQRADSKGVFGVRNRPIAVIHKLGLAGSMFVMESLEDLWEHIAYVIGYAPNFPYRDFLAADQQMTLGRAFEQLRQGVEIAYPEPDFAARREKLNDILDRSFSAYERGDEIAAGHLLNDFQDGIFKSDA